MAEVARSGGGRGGRLMFLGFCCILGFVAAVILGGDLAKLADLRIRLAWLVFAALATQVLVLTVLPDAHSGWAALAHDLTYAAALVVVWFNRKLFGMLVLGLGTLSNGVAIAVNGGTLPASAHAAAIAHVHRIGHGFDNSAPLAHAHLAWLGDIMVSPAWLPLRNTVSIGDLLILAGAILVVFQSSEAWPFRARAQRMPEGESVTVPEPVQA